MPKTKRLDIQAILTTYLKEVYTKNPSFLTPILYLSTATVVPEYFNKELGIGENTLLRIGAEVNGKATK